MKGAHYNEVIYQEFLEAAAELYDFKVCARSDGSYYGTADNNQCRVGTETTKADKEVSRDDVMKASGNYGLKGKRLATASAKLDALNDEEFAFVTTMATDMLKTEISPKTGMYTVEEHAALIKNEKKLLDGYENPEKLREGHRKVSDKEVDAMVDLMSGKAKGHLLPGDVDNRMKGSVENYSKEQTIKDLTRRWMEQEGKDLYTGRKLNFFEAELEHIKPIAVLGQKEADKIKNFGWIDRNVNQIKSNRTMQDFLDNRVKKYSPEEAKKRYDASLARKTAKGDLKKSAAADAKKVGDQAEHLIKKYGSGGVKYLARELGYSTGMATRDRVGRARGVDAFGNVQTKYSKGKRGERLENTLIRNHSKWSDSDRRKAQQLIAAHAGRVGGGENKQTSLNQLQKELEKLGS